MKKITFENLLADCNYDVGKYCDHFGFFMARLRLVEFLQMKSVEAKETNNKKIKLIYKT